MTLTSTRCSFCRGAGSMPVPFGLGLCVPCAARCHVEVDRDRYRARLSLVCDNAEKRYLVTVDRGAAAAAVATYEAALRVLAVRDRPG